MVDLTNSRVSKRQIQPVVRPGFEPGSTAFKSEALTTESRRLYAVYNILRIKAPWYQGESTAPGQILTTGPRSHNQRQVPSLHGKPRPRWHNSLDIAQKVANPGEACKHISFYI